MQTWLHSKACLNRDIFLIKITRWVFVRLISMAERLFPQATIFQDGTALFTSQSLKQKKKGQCKQQQKYYLPGKDIHGFTCADLGNNEAPSKKSALVKNKSFLHFNKQINGIRLTI